MTILEYSLLFVAAVFGGALNSVAGGGSFLTFPSLLFAGVSAIIANATSAVALWPGSLAAAIAYRDELRRERRWFVRLAAVGVAGGLIGALLLLRTSNATFVRLLPYLLLVAALVFTFGARLNARLRALQLGPIGERFVPVAGALLLLVIAVYGGYFGGGMGMMLLATFALVGMSDIHAMNALKNAMATLINFVAVVTFIAGQRVSFRPGLVMVAGAALGGYLGASLARRIAPVWVRRFVLVVAWSMTAYFFIRAQRTS